MAQKTRRRGERRKSRRGSVATPSHAAHVSNTHYTMQGWVLPELLISISPGRRLPSENYLQRASGYQAGQMVPLGLHGFYKARTSKKEHTKELIFVELSWKS
jgi:hypothetical protein